MGKARLGGDAIGRNPTDRGKPGTKRSILVEAEGGPLSVVVSGANAHDAKLLEATLASVVVERLSQGILCLSIYVWTKDMTTQRVEGLHCCTDMSRISEGLVRRTGRIGAETPTCAALGSGENIGMALKAQRHSGEIREEIPELPRLGSIGARTDMVSPLV